MELSNADYSSWSEQRRMKSHHKPQMQDEPYYITPNIIGKTEYQALSMTTINADGHEYATPYIRH